MQPCGGTDRRGRASPPPPQTSGLLPALSEHVGAGQKYIFTIDEGATGEDGRISVNYDGFINDVRSVISREREVILCPRQRTAADIQEVWV